MRLRAAVLLGLCCLAAAVWAVATRSAPAGPHPFMEDEGKCDLCHLVSWKGSEGELEEEKFSRPLTQMCNECHKERLGRSHPVGGNPYKRIPRDRYPGALPLQWSEELLADVMTCATCHDMHAMRFDEKKLYARQKPHPQGEGRYLTYYLRLRGDSPKQGYAPLCKACHPEF